MRFLSGLIAASIVLSSSGCGGSEVIGDPALVKPTAAVPCPHGLLPGDPLPKYSFDASTLVGMEYDDAVALGAKHRCMVRVIERDGHGFAITFEARPDRVNVKVNKGIVTEIKGVS